MKFLDNLGYKSKLLLVTLGASTAFNLISLIIGPLNQGDIDQAVTFSLSESDMHKLERYLPFIPEAQLDYLVNRITLLQSLGARQIYLFKDKLTHAPRWSSRTCVVNTLGNLEFEGAQCMEDDNSTTPEVGRVIGTYALAEMTFKNIESFTTNYQRDIPISKSLTITNQDGSIDDVIINQISLLSEIKFDLKTTPNHSVWMMTNKIIVSGTNLTKQHDFLVNAYLLEPDISSITVGYEKTSDFAPDHIGMSLDYSEKLHLIDQVITDQQLKPAEQAIWGELFNRINSSQES